MQVARQSQKLLLITVPLSSLSQYHLYVVFIIRAFSTFSLLCSISVLLSGKHRFFWRLWQQSHGVGLANEQFRASGSGTCTSFLPEPSVAWCSSEIRQLDKWTKRVSDWVLGQVYSLLGLQTALSCLLCAFTWTTLCCWCQRKRCHCCNSREKDCGVRLEKSINGEFRCPACCLVEGANTLLGCFKHRLSVEIPNSMHFVIQRCHWIRHWLCRRKGRSAPLR